MANFKGKSVLQPVGPLEKICFLTPFIKQNFFSFVDLQNKGKSKSGLKGEVI